ncbi:hypothetical protein FKB34_05535 [Glycocaulis profundi]|nr:hypothetical protein FKB34_05535 [Glycocaulis profundi]
MIAPGYAKERSAAANARGLGRPIACAVPAMLRP